MHLLMYDLDGTLLKSNSLDIHCFSGAFSCVMGIENIESDWTDYKYVTDEGIVSEIVARQLNRPATQIEILNIRTEIIGIGFYNNEAQLRQEGASHLLNDFSDKNAFWAKMLQTWAS